MNSKIWGVTGRTGTGKTKVINTLYYRLSSENISMGGILTRDIRKYGKRTGIEIMNISTGITFELADIDRKIGPRLQKFRINKDNIDNLIIDELYQSSTKAELLIIDMIGPMELFSNKFCDLLQSLLNEDKKKGDIITFVKTIGGEGVKPLQLAKKQDIDKRKYEDLMQSTFDQLLDSLGYSFDEILGATKLEDLFWPKK